MKVNLSSHLESYRHKLRQKLEPYINSSMQQILPAIINRLVESQSSLSHFGSEDNWDGSLYPDGTKFVLRGPKTCQIVLEQKPQVRTVTFRNHGNSSFSLVKDKWRLAFPYIVFVFNFIKNDSYSDWDFSGATIAYGKQPVKNLSDTVYHPNLPNISDFKLCTSGVSTSNNKSVYEQVDALLNHFWQGEFSTDWAGHFTKNLTGWECQTANDPLDILKQHFERPIKLSELVSHTSACFDYYIKNLRNSLIRQVSEISDSLKNQMFNVFINGGCDDLNREFVENVNREFIENVNREELLS